MPILFNLATLYNRQDDVDVEINFNSGKQISVEIQYEAKMASGSAASGSAA